MGVSEADLVTFYIPASVDEMFETFFRLPEELQRVYLGMMRVGAEQDGNPQATEMLRVLREDERTRELVTKLETTPLTKRPKSKAGRRRW